jgi:hypothetical protein
MSAYGSGAGPEYLDEPQREEECPDCGMLRWETPCPFCLDRDAYLDAEERLGEEGGEA